MFRQCDGHPDHMAAWNDQDVIRAASLLVEVSRRPILELAIQQMIVSPTSTSPLTSVLARILQVMRTPDGDPLREQGDVLLQCCFRIATDQTGPRQREWPSLRRGALLERLIAGLLSDRMAAIHHEHRISISGWESPCQDICGVSDGSPDIPYVEIYEAKTDVADLTNELIDLAAIHERVQDLGEVVVAVATLMPDSYVDAVATDPSIPAVVMRVTQETILGLAVRPPTDPLRTAA